jgi:phage replication O-like protein O
MSAQVENGYTRIANELVEALAQNHPGFTEGQVIWCVLRKTYGWNKKEDKISLSQLVQMTGKSRRMVIYAIQNLEAKKMIFVSRSFQQVNIITFNKNYNEWNKNESSEQYKKLHLVQKVAPSATNGKYLVQHSVNDIPKVAPTKETLTKETKQKKERLTSADSFFSKIQENPKGLEEKATKYDVREKDILYCVEQAGEWARGNSLADNTWVWWDGFLNRWISRAIRRHELKRLSDKTEDEPKKAKLSKDDLEALEILARCKVYG